MGRILVTFFAFAGCATTAPPAETTKYEVGDYVVYRYNSAGATPVTLREDVVARDGHRLTIEVAATRGSDARRWIQVVTDTPENQKNEVVDEVYEVVDGRRIRLPNEKNADLYRLYEWTIPPLGGHGKPTDVKRANVRLELAGTTFECQEERGRFADGNLSYSLATCPAFLWTNGPGRIARDDGTVIWTREVIEVGRR